MFTFSQTQKQMFKMENQRAVTTCPAADTVLSES